MANMQFEPSIVEALRAALAQDMTVLDKAKEYNRLQESGMDDATIRALVTEAVGPQTDEAWNWLTSADKVLGLAPDATVKDKASLYNDIQGLGFNDADIRNITQDVLGPQTDLAWNYLTSADKVNDVLGGSVKDKASTYNNLLNTSGLTKDQIANVINDVAGAQTPNDMSWLQDAATVQNASTGTAQQKADTYNQLLRAGRSPFEIRQITESAVGPQSDSDWSALETKAAVKGPLPQQTTTMPAYQSSLIENLRGKNTKPFSNNPGVSMMLNPANPKPSDWKPPMGTNSAFSPQPFVQTQASPQQVNDWNSYSAYRANAVSGSSPYLSLEEWLAQGKPAAAFNQSNAGGSSSSGGNTSIVPGGVGDNGGGGGSY